MATRYFENFDIINYNFGDNEPSALMQDISSYVDLIDQLKGEVSFYEDYTIKSNERPDTVSFKLYDTTEYYWTFFLLNDKLRESGWPLNREDLRTIAKQRYPHRTVTTKDDIATPPNNFPVGTVVTGRTSGTVGTIVKRNLDLGQLVIDTTNTVVESEQEFVVEPDTNGFVTIEVANENQTFDDAFLWQVTQDGGNVSGVNITINRLGKSATLSNIPFSESSEYVVNARVNTANPEDNNFGEGEIISYDAQNDGLPVELLVFKESEQYNAIHHYERKTYTAFNLDTVKSVFTSFDKAEARRVAERLDNGELRVSSERVDIDPFTQQVPQGAVPVTVFERLEKKNDDLKQIKVLKPDVVEELAENFYAKFRERV
mgnify:FL=1